MRKQREAARKARQLEKQSRRQSQSAPAETAAPDAPASTDKQGES
jgi:hypothetical protein